MHRRPLSCARWLTPAIAVSLAALASCSTSSATSSVHDAAVDRASPVDAGKDVTNSDARAPEAGAPDVSPPTSDASDATSGEAGEAGKADAPADAAVVLTVSLTGCNGAYAVPVTIGSEPFALLLDTGSSTLAVAETGCAACADAGLDASFVPTEGGLVSDAAVSAKYGLLAAPTVSSWKGDIYKSTVGIAGLEATVDLVGMTSESKILYDLVCTKPSGPFTVPYQGLMGFGVDAVLTPGTTEFFDQVVQQGAVGNVFSIGLCQANGTLWLGGYDPSSTSGPMQFTPMGTEAGYTVDWTAVAVATGDAGTSVEAGTSITMPASAANAFVDSGGQGIIIPDAAFQAVAAAVQESATFTSKFGAAWFSNSYFGPVTVPSANTRCITLEETPAQLDAELPALTLTLGAKSPVEVTLTATQSYLMYRYRAGSLVDYCQALMDSSALGVGVAQLAYLGDSLMLGHVVEFDRKNKRLGVASAVPCTN